ncbi:MAG: hypothetical protein U0470_09785 [Anaerolineae bacterium]
MHAFAVRQPRQETRAGVRAVARLALVQALQHALDVVRRQRRAAAEAVERAQALQPPDRRRGRALDEQPAQLVAQPRRRQPAETVERRAPPPPSRRPCGSRSAPRPAARTMRVGSSSKLAACRIRTTPASRSARPPFGSMSGPEAGGADPKGQRVHREVAPGQVVVQRAGRHVRQRAGPPVALPARRDQVDGHVPGPPRRRAEPRVLDDGAARHLAQPSGERDRVADGDDIEVVPDRPAEQEVARHAADEVRGDSEGVRAAPIAREAASTGGSNAAAGSNVDGVDGAVVIGPRRRQRRRRPSHGGARPRRRRRRRRGRARARRRRRRPGRRRGRARRRPAATR